MSSTADAEIRSATSSTSAGRSINSRSEARAGSH
jgi:hypothetical protein